ncbi:THAP domain-containing protein 1 B-like [Cydia fagiglandana]|uniref:THAP domain-containing protein 1 B-like n=1 Tax=Cydia fagiglandana TaxID=1458189 RepID=UPI002FEDE687
MPVCSVIGCGIRKTPNQPSLTLHRLPRNEIKKKKWLEAIGMENIRPRVKDTFICSLHFDEKCFNKTLDVTRLRDEAVPFTGLALNPAPVSGTSGVATSALPLTTATAYTGPFVSVTSTSGVDNLPAEAYTIKKLEAKCDFLRKKVKRLNEKLRLQRKKIAEFQNVIKDLQERNLVNNENSIVLEACVGPKDFLKRRILKSEGMPLEKQYSEETRKFAHTLHLISPKAYNFVRQTYNTCLPHPRTLIRWKKINAEPGLCDEAFAVLRNKVQANDTPIVP